MNLIEREKLSLIRERFDRNYRVSRLYASYLELYPEFITKEMMASLLSGASFSEKEGIVALLTELFRLERKNPCDLDIIKNYLTPSVRVLDTKKYTENPYYKNIRFDEAKNGEWELRWESYPAYRAFVAGDMVTLPDFTEYAPLGFFREDFSFPAVLEDGNEWMTLTPVDLDTSETAINRAHGRTVTFGLGLGYFAYMASRKSEVGSVTVIEKSEKVIELFEGCILPWFDFPEKIRIINADAFLYAEKEMPKENYDYAFVDTWRDASDGAPMYKKMKALEHLCPSCEFDYWVEGFLRSRLRAERFEECFERREKYESLDGLISELSGKRLTDG